jgi:hypothetical protein
MQVISDTNMRGSHSSFIRLGGIAVLLGLAIHVVANSVLKTFPPDQPTLEELRAYFVTESRNWAVVHGLRYIAFPCVLLFAVSLYVRTGWLHAERRSGWGLLGLLGAMLMVTNGVITNGLETFAFLGSELLSGQPDLFWLLFRVTRTLFTAEIVAWAVFILGFSLAGTLSGMLPRWLCVLGICSGFLGFLSSIFLVSVLSDGWASGLIDIAATGSLLWFAATGVYLVVRGAS